MEIQVKQLDELVFKEQLPAPQHFKIDTEGFETPILLGEKGTLRRYRPFVYAEVHAALVAGKAMSKIYAKSCTPMAIRFIDMGRSSYVLLITNGCCS